MKFKSFESVDDETISKWMNDKIVIYTNTAIGQFLIHEGYPEHGSQTVVVHTFIYENKE